MRENRTQGLFQKAGLKVFGHTSLSGNFTLVELLVVIVILTILAGMLLPVLSKGRDKANAIGCLNNEKQIMLMILSYINDYNGMVKNGKAIGGGNVSWGAMLQRTGYDRSESMTPFTPSQLYHCPKSEELSSQAYCMVSGDANVNASGHNFQGDYVSGRLRNPTRKFVIMDAINSNWTINYYSQFTVFKVEIPGTSKGYFARHSGYFNVGFIDGHAKPVFGLIVKDFYDPGSLVPGSSAKVRYVPNM